MIHMSRHSSVMKCSWNDENNFQSFLHHQGAQQGSGTAPAMGTGPSWEMLPVPLGKDRNNSKPKQLPGMQCHQDSWVQQSPRPLDTCPHSWGGRNCTCAACRANCTERGDSCTAFQPALLKWQNNSNLFHPSNDFNRLLSKTSSRCPAH